MKKILYILILPITLFLVSCGGGDGEITPVITVNPITSADPTDSLHTWIPDSNFEQQLIDQSLDNVLDNQVLTSKIDTIKRLNLSDLILMGIPEIKNFTGIEDFISLEHLNILDNPVEIINIELSFFTISFNDFKTNK